MTGPAPRGLRRVIVASLIGTSLGSLRAGSRVELASTV